MHCFYLNETQMLKIPVLLIVFNRPSLTIKVMERIKAAKPSKVYISADAPRKEIKSDFKKCEKVRQIIDSFDFECEVIKQYHQANKGCSLGPRSAFEWFFKHEEMGIILEDDCLPSKSFFLFCEEMLFYYKDNKKVTSINGSNLGFSLNDDYSYTYSKFMNMWGWATWRRVYNEVDFELNSWKKTKFKSLKLIKLLGEPFLFPDINWIKYWRFQFDMTINTKKLTWWDYQWIFYQLESGTVSVVPKKNLVSNLGFSEEGTHTLHQELPASNLRTYEIEFPLRHTSSIRINKKYEKEYVKKIWSTYNYQPMFFFLKNFLLKLLKK